MEISEGEFYSMATEIARNSTNAKFLGKSPALLLPLERAGKGREEYYQALLHRIKDNKTRTGYIFSLPYMISEISRMNKKAAGEVLENWKNLANNANSKNFDFRFVDAAFTPCIIGDKKILLKKEGKRHVISCDVKGAENLLKESAAVLKQSSAGHGKIIKEILRTL